VAALAHRRISDLNPCLAKPDVLFRTSVLRPIVLARAKFPLRGSRSSNRTVSRPSRLTTSKSPSGCLSEKLLWYVPAILCELLEDGLMQPHVHLRRISHLLLGAFQFGRKPLSRLEAAIQVEELEQIHN
jgi:hypothetical protein